MFVAGGFFLFYKHPASTELHIVETTPQFIVVQGRTKQRGVVFPLPNHPDQSGCCLNCFHLYFFITSSLSELLQIHKLYIPVEDRFLENLIAEFLIERKIPFAFGTSKQFESLCIARSSFDLLQKSGTNALILKIRMHDKSADEASSIKYPSFSRTDDLLVN